MAGASGSGASTGAILGATPAMGWNNFNHFVDAFTHITFEQAADAMVSSGLKAVGYDTTRYTDANFPKPGISSFAGPGHFNDPDMLEVGNAGMTDTEQRAQFSLWAIMAAPLILGNDLTKMSAATLETLTNPEVIAVDQDPLGKQGTPISQSTCLEVWAKPLAGRNTFAVALFNRTNAAAPITATWSSLGIAGAVTVRDLWAKKDLGTMPTQYSVSVPSHAVALLKVVGQ